MTSGVVNSFGVLFVMRFILGAFQSAQTPTSLTLLSDYFPRNKRSTVNSILNSGVYIGSALSSISIITIGQIGWRSTFAVMGGIGVAIGSAILLFMKEPERGRFDTDSKVDKQ